jgi:hypothetical protein
MLDLLLYLLWFAFGAYSAWFFTQAKKLQPITLDELVILWKLHRLHEGCDAPISKVEAVIEPHSDEFVGFQCQCGYRYLSERLITQRNARQHNMFYFVSPGETGLTTSRRL